MNKLDLKKRYKELYNPSADVPVVLEVPAMQFLMIDGVGNPNTAPAYQEAILALYGVSYTVKFMMKKEQGLDYSVMPLEGLWWGTAPGETYFSERDKDTWQWTMMIMQPDFVNAEMVAEGIRRTAAKKNLPALEKLRFAPFGEGWVVQVMYVGPYAHEGAAVEHMHQYALAQGYELTGKHHEIYLGDPRSTAPEKLKTVLRNPVRKQE